MWNSSAARGRVGNGSPAAKRPATPLVGRMMWRHVTYLPYTAPAPILFDPSHSPSLSLVYTAGDKQRVSPAALHQVCDDFLHLLMLSRHLLPNFLTTPTNSSLLACAPTTLTKTVFSDDGTIWSDSVWARTLITQCWRRSGHKRESFHSRPASEPPDSSTR